MPELPEVETVKNELIPHVVGRCVSGVTLFWEGLVRQPPVAEFRCRLVGQKITGITRRGKYLTFSLNSGGKLVIHLRMTGSLLLKPDSSEPERFIRAILCLDDGTAIHFRDPRKFGRMWLAKDERDVLPQLGPEPLQADFTPRNLHRLLSKRRAPIKALLLE